MTILADSEYLAVAQEEARLRLARDLTPGELRVDLVGLDRDLVAGKKRLREALRAERRRAARAWARDVNRGIRMRVSPEIRAALRGLYDAGRSHARAELVAAGLDPDDLARGFAVRLNPRLAVIADRIQTDLDELGPDLEHRAAIALDLGEASVAAIVRAVQRLPGIDAIAADWTTPAAYGGLGDVWTQADQAGVTTGWTYSAMLDPATCETCALMDGTSYDSWEAIQDVLPDGGPNPDCDGGTRCRCRAVPEFSRN